MRKSWAVLEVMARLLRALNIKVLDAWQQHSGLRSLFFLYTRRLSIFLKPKMILLEWIQMVQKRPGRALGIVGPLSIENHVTCDLLTLATALAKGLAAPHTGPH